MSRSTLGIIALALTTLLCGACDSDPPEADKAPVVTEQVDAGQPDASAAPRLRMAYGIPLPPQVMSVREQHTNIVVMTSMSVEELEDFYAGRLTDFEVIRDGLNLQIVGLRSNMASVIGGHPGYRHLPVELIFYAPKPEKQKPLNLKGEPVAREYKPAPEDWFDSGVAGTAVKMRTEDGQLMAPGAVWGKPYTPPKGSFFDQRTFKPNWGRPFGEWTVH